MRVDSSITPLTVVLINRLSQTNYRSMCSLRYLAIFVFFYTDDKHS